MTTRLAKLGELVTIAGGGTPARGEAEYWGPDIPWATVKDLDGLELARTQESITHAGLTNCASSLVPAGSLVIATRMALGKAAVNAVDLAINQDLKALTCGPDVETRYLLHFLVSQASRIEAMGKGATVKGVTLDRLTELLVPIPPLAEQRRIAAVLDKADAIRRKHRESIKLLDEFLRSAFLEMFGDPVRNEKGWDQRRLSGVAHLKTGNTPPRNNPRYYGEDIEWIKSDNINTPGHYLTSAKEGLSADGRRIGRTATAGSILMTCIAGSPDCIGNVAITDREVAFNQQINAIEPGPEIDYRFLYVALLVGKRLVQRASSKSMKGMVSKGALETVLVPLPPIELQARFGKLFTRVLAARTGLERARDDGRLLFDALAQRAFGGEGTE